MSSVAQSHMAMPIIDPEPGPSSNHGMTYLRRAFQNPAVILMEAEEHLRGLHFDTLVGVGMSGALVVPTLARAMGRHFMIVRKNNDNSHSMSDSEGTMGKRWIFVDDLISSGKTLRRAQRVVSELSWYDGGTIKHPDTQFVGALFWEQHGSYFVNQGDINDRLERLP